MFGAGMAGLEGLHRISSSIKSGNSSLDFLLA